MMYHNSNIIINQKHKITKGVGGQMSQKWCMINLVPCTFCVGGKAGIGKVGG